jgi:hypothetical protein
MQLIAFDAASRVATCAHATKAFAAKADAAITTARIAALPQPPVAAVVKWHTRNGKRKLTPRQHLCFVFVG